MSCKTNSVTNEKCTGASGHEAGWGASTLYYRRDPQQHERRQEGRGVDGGGGRAVVRRGKGQRALGRGRVGVSLIASWCSKRWSFCPLASLGIMISAPPDEWLVVRVFVFVFIFGDTLS